MLFQRYTPRSADGALDMKHHFTLDGVGHRAWLAHVADSYVLIADGVTPIHLEQMQSGRATLCVGRRSHEILLATQGDVSFVSIDGREYEIVFENAIGVFEHQAAKSGDAIVRAPMPGSVVDAPVSAGDEVSAGDVLIVIESMKLETSLRATRNGVVETVHFQQGETFERDAALVTLARVPEA